MKSVVPGNVLVLSTNFTNHQWFRPFHELSGEPATTTGENATVVYLGTWCQLTGQLLVLT